MNMFATAKPIPAKKTAGKKATVETVQTTDLHLYAALKAVETNVKGQLAIAEASIKGQMGAHFVAEGATSGRRPVNYAGIDQGSTGSLQLRARSSASALSVDECELLTDNGIPYGEAIDRDETFIVNPEYAGNMEMLTKVSEALESLGLPADFFQKQEKVSKNIATDESMAAVFATKNADKISALLPLVTTMAIRATLAEGANPFMVVDAALGDPTADAKALEVSAKEAASQTSK